MVVDTSAPLRDIVEQYKGKNASEMYEDLNQIPFFMTEFQDNGEENVQVEALRALAYEGEPLEVAENFKAQGNDCFRRKQFKDAAQFYTQALDQRFEHAELTAACLGNRAQCNLELKNYRRCITDCSRVLDTDPGNVKAWFRSAKAFLLLDKPAECIACCLRGLHADPANAAISQLQHDAEAREQILRARAEERARQAELKHARAQALQTACAQRGLEFKSSVQNQDEYKHLSLSLEDPLDASSLLYIPVLALYPMAMESDILTRVGEDVLVEDILTQLFAPPPPWADSGEYAVDKLDVFVPTASGGLARAGPKSTLQRVFRTKGVVLIDNLARLYVVPKNRVQAWLGTWNKEVQAKQLKE